VSLSEEDVMNPTIPPSTECASKTLSAIRRKALARFLAVSVSLAAMLIVMLGCSVTNKLVNKPPPDPTATPSAISVHEVTQTTTLSGGQTGPVIATCPQGEFALSGGWDIPSQSARVFAAKVTNNGWAVSVLPLGHPATTTVTAYVECLRGATGTVITQRAITKTIAPTVASDQVDNASITAGSCQQNEGLVGFGFDFGAAAADRLELEGSVPSDYLHTYLWSFLVWNFDTVAHDVTFDLQCLTTTGQGSTSDSQQVGSILYSGGSGSAVALCPAGTMVAGGGFKYSRYGTRASYLGNEYSLHATSTGWQSSVLAVSGYGLIPIYPEGIAVCMTLT
jgi:hypothetical protein